MIKFFTADWCVACNNLKNSLTEEDLALVTMVDVDKDPTAVINAGIKSVPAIIKYSDDGEIVDRAYGTMTPSQFRSFCE